MAAQLTTRILPRGEWPRLAGTLLDPAWKGFDDSARVIVVERDGTIVATAALFQAWHLDAVWLAEQERGNAAVGRALLREVRAQVAEIGTPEVAMMALTDEGRRICEGLGEAVHLDCDHFAVKVKHG